MKYLFSSFILFCLLINISLSRAMVTTEVHSSEDFGGFKSNTLFDSYHTSFNTCEADGGVISTTDPTTICAGDGMADPISVTVAGASGSESAWVITDDADNILALPPSGPFDLEGAGAGVCLIWYLRYDGVLTGLEMGNNLSDLTGCYDLSNSIAVTRNQPEGGTISTTDPTTICAGDGMADPISVTVAGASGSESAWIITDDADNILALPPGGPFDLEGAGAGVCLIWYLRYDGVLTGLEMGNNLSDLGGCYDLSNSIVVTRNQPEGGMISTTDPTTICAGDGMADPISVTVAGASGSESAWIITDDADNILALPPDGPFDLEGAGAGVCLIWYLRYDGVLTGLEMGNNLSGLGGCYDLSNSIAVTRNQPEGGTISTTDPTTICAGDGMADPISVTVAGASGSESAWIITDDADNILALPPGGPFDLEGAGAGVCLIWYLRYDGVLTGLEMGNNLSDLSGCYDLSNAIAVTRVTDGAPCCPTAAPDIYDINVLSTTSALATWELVPGATFYQVWYRMRGTTDWSIRGTANAQRALSDLQPNRYYQYRIRSQCGDGTWSDFTPIGTFYASTCDMPTGINSVYLDQVRVKIRWGIDPNSVKGRVKYREVGTSTWLIKGGTPGNNFLYITGLTPNTNYEYRVRVQCANGDWSAFSEDKYFFNTNAQRLFTDDVGIEEMKLYPNPAQEEVNVSFESVTSNEVRIVITDILGKVIQSKVTVPQEGSNIETINVSRLTEGYYFLTVHNGNDVKTIKFIKS